MTSPSRFYLLTMSILDQHDAGQKLSYTDLYLVYYPHVTQLMCMCEARSSLALPRIDHWRRSGHTHSRDTHQGSDRRRGCREGWISTGLRLTSSLVPRLPRNPNMYTWYLFSCENDIPVIKVGPEFLEQKGQRFVHCSTNHVFNARCVWYSTPDS